MIQLPRTKAPAGKAAYSLVELVVALGILAIALPMVAAVFLPGALENAESVKHTMGTLVAENALAIVRARVSHADLSGVVQAGQPVLIPEALVP
ncbi:MAG: type IV pilus modification PilV family protein, partial [Planctomycetota bacterium]